MFGVTGDYDSAPEVDAFAHDIVNGLSHLLQAAAQKTAPAKKAAPQKAAPSKKAASQKAAPQKAAPSQKAAPAQKAAPRKAAPQKTAPVQKSPRRSRRPRPRRPRPGRPRPGRPRPGRPRPGRPRPGRPCRPRSTRQSRSPRRPRDSVGVVGRAEAGRPRRRRVGAPGLAGCPGPADSVCSRRDGSVSSTPESGRCHPPPTRAGGASAAPAGRDGGHLEPLSFSDRTRSAGALGPGPQGHRAGPQPVRGRPLRPGRGHVTAASRGFARHHRDRPDPDLTTRQRQALIEVYQALTAVTVARRRRGSAR